MFSMSIATDVLHVVWKGSYRRLFIYLTYNNNKYLLFGKDAFTALSVLCFVAIFVSGIFAQQLLAWFWRLICSFITKRISSACLNSSYDPLIVYFPIGSIHHFRFTISFFDTCLHIYRIPFNNALIHSVPNFLKKILPCSTSVGSIFFM